MELYTRVKLLTDKYDNLHEGMLGYIIEIYEKNMFEVEFSDFNTGETIEQIVLPLSEITIDENGA